MCIRTKEDLWNYSNMFGKEAVKELLKQYVYKGQPDNFCGNCGTRRMAAVASKGIEGTEYNGEFYLDTEYGTEIYHYMWNIV